MGNAIIVEPYDLSSASFVSGNAAGTLGSYLNNDWMGVVARAVATAPADGASADLGVARPVDTLALLSCNSAVSICGILGGTSSGSGDLYNVSGQTFAAGATVPTSGRINQLHLIASPITARHWFTNFTTYASATAFEAGRWVIGQRYAPARNFSFGASFGAIDRGGGDFNAQGVWLPRPGAIQRSLGLSFSATTRAEAEATLLPLLERVGNRKHILLVTDPDASALRQRRMYFGPLIGNLETLWRVADGWEWRANLVSTI